MSNEKYCVKEGYVLRQLAGEFLAVPVSEEATENGKIIILNPVSHFI